MVRPDAVDAARKLVAELARFTPSLDAVMITGDVTDGGLARDYDLAREILAPITAPVFVVPGNHDRRDEMRAAFGADIPFASGQFLNYTANVGSLRVIGLDTLVEGRVEGALLPETLDWLETQFASPHSGHTCILMHHPSFPSGIRALDAEALTAGAARFMELVAAYRGPLQILAGHIHRPYQSVWHGVLAAVAGSPAFQVQLALEPDAGIPPISSDEPYSFFIHRITNDGVAIHRRRVSL